MALLSELDVINDQLATLGETPLNSVEEDHPYVAAGLRFLRVANHREQAKGWWFNKEIVTLTPDVNGFIFTPTDAISVDPVTPSNAFVQRGRRLYNPATTAYVFTLPVECKLIRLVAFDELPPSAASYIGLSAVLVFQRSYDADPQKTKDLTLDMRQAYTTLNAEHIRNQNVNMLDKPSTAALNNRLGFNVTLGGLRN